MFTFILRYILLQLVRKVSMKSSIITHILDIFIVHSCSLFDFCFDHIRRENKHIISYNYNWWCMKQLKVSSVSKLDDETKNNKANHHVEFRKALLFPFFCLDDERIIIFLYGLPIQVYVVSPETYFLTDIYL